MQCYMRRPVSSASSLVFCLLLPLPWECLSTWGSWVGVAVSAHTRTTAASDQELCAVCQATSMPCSPRPCHAPPFIAYIYGIQVGTGHGHHYQRWRACILPLTAPLPLFMAAPVVLEVVGRAGLLYGAAYGAAAGAVIWTIYPPSNVPRRALKGAA